VKKLVLQKRVFLTAVIICAAALTAAFVWRFTYWDYCFCFALMGGTLAAALFFAARKKQIAAEIIVENAIIHIQPAVICAQSDDEKKEGEKLREKLGIFISCFGILLGGKIIKFGKHGNCDIRLKSVEIGPDYISIDYIILIDHYSSINKELQNIRLIYSRPGSNELADIIKKFREETKVVPVVTESQEVGYD